MLKRVFNSEYFQFNSKTVFFPVFIGLICCYYYARDYSFALNHSFNGIVAWTAFDNFDTNARLSLFYMCLFMAAAVFIAGLFTLSMVRKLFPILSAELCILNYVGIFGSMTLVYMVFNGAPSVTLDYLYGAVFLALFGMIFHLALKERYPHATNPIEYFMWCLIAGFLSFIIADNIVLYANGNHLNDFVYYVYLFSGLVFIVSLCLFLLIKVDFTLLIKYSVVLPFFALHTLLTNEIVFSLNQHNLSVRPLWVLIIGYCIILCAFSVYFYYTLSVKSKSILHILSQVYFPVTLAIIALYGNYHSLVPHTSELFETANPANAMMRSFHFGEIPFLHYINSHGLSETLYGFLFILLNGYSGSMDFLAFDVIFFAVFILIAYYWLMKITSNPAFSFAFALLLPFLDTLFVGQLSIVLLSVFFLRKIHIKASVKNMIWNYLWIGFVIFWRIDAGFSNLLAQLSVLILLLIFKMDKKAFRNFAFATLILALFVMFLGGLLFLTERDVFINIKQALHYFGANQAHGSLSMGNSQDRLFVIHYMLFPAIILFIGFYLLFRKKQFLEDFNFIYISLLFLIVFYFSNAQRGLVRHGFNDSSDLWITSFSFLIIALFVYLLSLKSRKVYKNAVLLGGVFFLILFFKYPACGGFTNLLDQFHDSYQHYVPFSYSKQKIIRYQETDLFAKDTYLDIKEFMDNNFSPRTTFLDFSNTPMLYFYTQRQMPSYFNQYLQNTVDEYLQQQNLISLSETDVPVVVYSNVPPSWFDMTDGVENSCRYFLIAEHIFRNYHPFIILNHHSLWLKNGWAMKRGNYQLDTLSSKPHQTELKKLSYLEGLRAQNYTLPVLWEGKNADIKQCNNGFEITLPDSFDRTSGNYIEFSLLNNSAGESGASLVLCNDTTDVGSFRFTVMGDHLHSPAIYRIRVSTQYAWYSEHPGRLRFVFDEQTGLPEIKNIRLLKALPYEN